jgi:hypothetical protein
MLQEGEPGGNQFSPVAIAGLLVLAGAGGGLLLNGVADVASEGLQGVPAITEVSRDPLLRCMRLRFLPCFVECNQSTARAHALIGVRRTRGLLVQAEHKRAPLAPGARRFRLGTAARSAGRANGAARSAMRAAAPQPAALRLVPHASH